MTVATPDKSTLNPLEFNVELEPHVLTDKDRTKLVPCTECQRCCVVTTFMAPAKVKCNECSSTTNGSAATGTQAIVQPGRTDPSKATNLADCLINKGFAHAICPHDPTHTMELKDVCHAPNYGPRHLLGYKDNLPQYKQETGESVMHQCKECATLVCYSTQHPQQMRRVNEPRNSVQKGPGTYEVILGVRD